MKSEIKNGIIISIIVVLVLAIVYFITAVFMTGEIGGSTGGEKTESTQSNSASNYENKIIAGRVFNQPEDNYMVILFSENDASDDLKNAISNYDSDSKDVKLYKVLLNEAVNKYVVSSKDNTTPSSSKDLKVKKSALLTVSFGSVTSYLTDEEQIINALK